MTTPGIGSPLNAVTVQSHGISDDPSSILTEMTSGDETQLILSGGTNESNATRAYHYHSASTEFVQNTHQYNNHNEQLIQQHHLNEEEYQRKQAAFNWAANI